MHIPSGETSTLELLPFREALTQALTPKADYDVNRWLYVPPFYCEYRYILATRGQRPLICVGINPSTAAPDDLDNTLKSVERVALHNGFDSFVMFNVYPQRATDPAFDYVLSLYEDTQPAIWAAWGTIIEKRDYLPACVRDMIAIGQTHGAAWYTAGKRSKKGHPHHPLYLRKDSGLDPFDVEEYLDSLN